MNEDPRRDLELVRSLLGGSERAEAEFLERMICIPRILHGRNRALGGPWSPETLEDLAQEVIAQVWTRLSEYRGRGSLEAWVYRFCRFIELNAWRKRNRQPDALEEADEESLMAGETDLADFDDHDRVRAALKRLTPEERAVILEKHRDQATFEEVGERLGISPNTAKTRYYRALQRLRQVLRGDSNEREDEA